MANQVVWSTPAMGMVPTSRTVREGKYVTTAGRVKFDLGQTGTISFIAAVTTALPAGEYALRALLERESPDLFGTKITLRKARRFGGEVSTILTCGPGVQGGSVSNNIRFSDSASNRFALDLDADFYWVQVDDVEQTPITSQTIKATLGVSLIRVG